MLFADTLIIMVNKGIAESMYMRDLFDFYSKVWGIDKPINNL